MDTSKVIIIKQKMIAMQFPFDSEIGLYSYDIALISTDKINKETFHYDFITLFKSNFEKDVAEVYDPKGINFEFMHSQQHKENTLRNNKTTLASTNSNLKKMANIHKNTFYK